MPGLAVASCLGTTASFNFLWICAVTTRRPFVRPQRKHFLNTANCKHSNIDIGGRESKNVPSPLGGLFFFHALLRSLKGVSKVKVVHRRVQFGKINQATKPPKTSLRALYQAIVTTSNARKTMWEKQVPSCTL